MFSNLMIFKRLKKKNPSFLFSITEFIHTFCRHKTRKKKTMYVHRPTHLSGTFSTNLLSAWYVQCVSCALWSLWSIRDNRYYTDGYKNIYMTTMDLDAVKTECRVLWRRIKGDLIQRRGGVGCCGRRRVRVREAVKMDVAEDSRGKDLQMTWSWVWKAIAFSWNRTNEWWVVNGKGRVGEEAELQMETRAHGVFHIILRNLGSILRTTRDKEY